ncbi:pentapeptide repeat-containing protein, partial [Nonomuraea sp. NPDC049784]|uniref:pentapeptide repeat-containing protein n=1 Tax=Nonomuraea sp. NPDC049784 TaxID=3154361 RepID=UPI0033EA7868
ARLVGAELRRADLSGASLRGADLTRCDLRGSDLSTLDPHTVTLKGAIIDPFQATVVATALGLDVRD